MPTIDFHTYNPTTIKDFKPILAKDLVPDWWKKSKVAEVVNGVKQQTIRACPAMDDWLKMGWYLCANRDMEVIQGISHKDEEGIGWASVRDLDARNWLKGTSSSSHPHTQLMDGFAYMDKSENPPVKDAFKMRNPWCITTPEGYSTFYLDPFLHQNKYFSTWQGIIDTDKFNNGVDNAQIIFYPKVDHNFTILKGTPLCQIIPFKREEWVGTYALKTTKSEMLSSSRLTTERETIGMPEAFRILGVEDNRSVSAKTVGPYKKMKYWNPKQRYFNEESPPPECPYHVSEDSPEIQLELPIGDTDGS